MTLNQVIMWPTEMLAQIQLKKYYPSIVGLGVGYFAFGLPSPTENIQTFAMWYLTTGAAYMVAESLIYKP